MKELRYLGLIGGLFLLLAGILPIGKINSDAVTIFPVFDNLKLGVGIWLWRDIVAFAITFGLLSILVIIFSLKKWELGNIISGVLISVVTLFIFFAVWMAYSKSLKFSDVTFTFGYAWLIIIAALALLFYENIKAIKTKGSKGRRD